jgi:hypothetical protein
MTTCLSARAKTAKGDFTSIENTLSVKVEECTGLGLFPSQYFNVLSQDADWNFNKRMQVFYQLQDIAGHQPNTHF